VLKSKLDRHQPAATYIDQRADGTVAVRGELRFGTVAKLCRSIDFSALPGSAVTVDLSGVDRVDSAGLALCLEWVSQAQGQAVAITFRSAPEQLQRLVRMNRLDDLFLNDQ